MSETDKLGHERHGEHPDQLGTEHGGVDYERRDANPRKIMIATVSLLVILIVMIFGIAELFMMTVDQQITDAVLKPPSAQLRDIKAKEQEVLNNYKVIDAAKGVYQIPIARAMELAAEEAYQKTQKSKPSEKKAVK